MRVYGELGGLLLGIRNEERVLFRFRFQSHTARITSSALPQVEARNGILAETTNRSVVEEPLFVLADSHAW